MSDDDKSTPNMTVVIICMTILAVFIIGTCAAVFIAVPDGANTGTLITTFMQALAPTIASIGALVIAVRTRHDVKETKENTHQLLNGTMERKIETVLRRVMAEGFDEHGDPVPTRSLPERDQNRG